MAELETEGMTGFLQLRAGLEKAIPGVRELLEADFGEPVRAVVHQLADIAEWNRLPLAVDDDRVLDRIVPATRLLADLFGDVADIDQPRAEQKGPVEERQRHVRPRTGLGDSRDAGLQAADADQIVVDPDAGGL